MFIISRDYQVEKYEKELKKLVKLLDLTYCEPTHKCKTEIDTTRKIISKAHGTEKYVYTYSLISRHQYKTDFSHDEITNILKKHDYIQYQDIIDFAKELIAKQHGKCVICQQRILNTTDLARSIHCFSRETIDFILEHPETLEDKIICCDCYMDMI